MVRVLTPMLPGAVGVIRLRGPSAVSILGEVFEPVRTRDLAALSPEQLCYGRLIDEGEPLDEVLVAVTPSEALGPVVDINAHGGTRVVQRIVMLLERLGAVAGPDEVVTWPADNAIQREVDELLVRAKTRRVALWLARQRALLPAGLRSVAVGLSRAACDDASATIAGMLAGYSAARRLLDGVMVALVGPVNAGKSTLVNVLAGREQSIATDQPGTTRDWVAGEVSFAGVPAELVDTAGVRQAGEILEHQAMHRGLDRAMSAEVVVWVVDGSKPLVDPVAWPGLTETCRDRLITVLNQSDKDLAVRPSDLPEGFAERVVRTSARTGEGVERLIERIVDLIGLSEKDFAGPVLLTPRQRDLAAKVLEQLKSDPTQAARTIVEELIGGGRAAR